MAAETSTEPRARLISNPGFPIPQNPDICQPPEPGFSMLESWVFGAEKVSGERVLRHVNCAFSKHFADGKVYLLTRDTLWLLEKFGWLCCSREY